MKKIGTKRRGEIEKQKSEQKKITTINEHVKMADKQRKTFYRYKSVRCLCYESAYPCEA